MIEEMVYGFPKFPRKCWDGTPNSGQNDFPPQPLIH
jgi:hypothetical protein